MRTEDLLRIISENVVLALLALVIIGLLFLVIFKGRTKLSKTRLFIISIFIFYIIMVVGVTLLNRGASVNQGAVNLSFLSTYIEAWNQASLRAWQNIYLNMVMFVPFGFLLPIAFKKVEKFYLVGLLSLLFSLVIEIIQLITGRGVFDLADLFNNLIGGIIGFGLIKSLYAIRKKNVLEGLKYLSPLFIVLIISSAMYSYYILKDYGNLYVAPSKKIDMATVSTTTNLSFSNESEVAAVYKAPSLSKEEAEQFALSFFEHLPPNNGSLEIIDYQNEAYYRLHGDPSFFIWVDYLDGSFSFTDFSSFNETSKPASADEKTLKEKLNDVNITIPNEAQFEEIEIGRYQWEISQFKKDHYLIDGILNVAYYDDDSIKDINHHMVTYHKVEDVSIKSEQEAFNELLDGKFKLYKENDELNTIHVEAMNLGYNLDSKGFYQPVYEFKSIIDGQEVTITIPAV